MVYPRLSKDMDDLSLYTARIHFLKENFSKLSSKVVLENILRITNSRIYQANASWYIVSNSNYYDTAISGALTNNIKEKDAIDFEYKIYTDCNSTTTQIFKGELGDTFPSILNYNSICWSNPQSTITTSNVDILGLPSFTNCTTCNNSTYIFAIYTQCDSTNTKVFRVQTGQSFPSIVKSPPRATEPSVSFVFKIALFSTKTLNPSAGSVGLWEKE